MTGGDDTENRLSVIQETIRDDPHQYWRSEALQTEHRSLIEAKEAGGNPANLQDSASARELARITEIMKNDPRQYWRSPDLQARYLELLKAETGEADQDANLHLDANRQAGLRIVTEMRRDLEEAGSWADVEGSFDALPETVHDAVEDALSWRPSPTSASPESISKFSSLPEQAELAAEWGEAAPAKLATVQARMWAIADRLNEDELRSARFWFNALTAPEAKAIIRAMAR